MLYLSRYEMKTRYHQSDNESRLEGQHVSHRYSKRRSYKSINIGGNKEKKR